MSRTPQGTVPKGAPGFVRLNRPEGWLPSARDRSSRLASVIQAWNFAEHFFPVLILLGLATRLSALALLGMTAVIQLLVYPGAYPTHGVWAAVLLYLVAHGPGKISIDHWIAQRENQSGA